MNAARRSLLVCATSLTVLALAAGTAHAEKADGGDRERPVAVGVLGGVGFPRPLSVEGVVRIDRRVLLGAEYGFLPPSQLGGVEASLWSAAGDARLFPFRGAFFVGVRGGRQHVRAATAITVPTVGESTEAIEVGSWFVNPRLGFLWTWRSGFALGVDAGVHVPVSSSTSTTLPPEAQGDPRVTFASRALGKTVLPTLDLLRVGLVL